jgi:hypothetical protein
LENGIHEFELVSSEGTLKARVIKFTLLSGEVETLVTNIREARISIKEFKELYFMRGSYPAGVLHNGHALECDRGSNV